MREVIRIPETTCGKKKPVEFTHCFESNGWGKSILTPNDYEKIVYLGECVVDGDMFSAYDSNGVIEIYKGHLNSGKY